MNGLWLLAYGMATHLRYNVEKGYNEGISQQNTFFVTRMGPMGL